MRAGRGCPYIPRESCGPTRTESELSHRRHVRLHVLAKLAGIIAPILQTLPRRSICGPVQCTRGVHWASQKSVVTLRVRIASTRHLSLCRDSAYGVFVQESPDHARRLPPSTVTAQPRPPQCAAPDLQLHFFLLPTTAFCNEACAFGLFQCLSLRSTRRLRRCVSPQWRLHRKMVHAKISERHHVIIAAKHMEAYAHR